MKKYLVFTVLCVACGGEPFDAFSETAPTDDGGSVAVDGGGAGNGGEPSAAGAPGDQDASSSDAGPVVDAGGGSGGSGGDVAADAAGDVGGTGGTHTTGGAPSTGGVEAGGAGGEAGASTGGAPPVVELCCKFSGVDTVYATCDTEEPWLCNGAQTYSCVQDGLCGLGAACYKSNGPFGGTVEACP